MINGKFKIFVTEEKIYDQINFEKYPFEVFYFDSKYIPYSEITALFIGLKFFVNDKFISKFNKLKYIVTPTTGTDHISVNKYYRVINLDPNEIESISATAEFTLTILMSLIRKLPFIDKTNLNDRYLYRGAQLYGKKIGIFGMGRLGKKMKIYSEALGMQVYDYDIYSSEDDKKKILMECDILSIHLPLNESTKNFITMSEFNLMKKSVYIVNTSRPQIINKNDLIIALQNEKIAGLAMDFVSYNADNILDVSLEKFTNKNLFLTPHIAGNTSESLSISTKTVINKFCSILKD